MRRLAARAHLWGGLVTGPFLLVLGVSGSALVFAPEIERLERPAAPATPAAAAPSLDTVLAAALIGQPGAEPRALRLPARPAEPLVVELARRSSAACTGGAAPSTASSVAARSSWAGSWE